MSFERFNQAFDERRTRTNRNAVNKKYVDFRNMSMDYRLMKFASISMTYYASCEQTCQQDFDERMTNDLHVIGCAFLLMEIIFELLFSLFLPILETSYEQGHNMTILIIKLVRNY